MPTQAVPAVPATARAKALKIAYPRVPETYLLAYPHRRERSLHTIDQADPLSLLSNTNGRRPFRDKWPASVLGTRCTHAVLMWYPYNLVSPVIHSLARAIPGRP